MFYTTLIEGQMATLPEEEARHCTQVMRMRPGDPVLLVDGLGGFYSGVLAETGKKRCTVRIERAEQEYGKRSFYLHMAVAPTKNIDRFEWFLEKATEIGVDEITPLLCTRSERKTLRTDRCEKVLIAAMKQSLQAYLPKLHPLTPFSSFCRELSPDYDRRLIAYIDENVKDTIKQNYHRRQRVCILIGPEGDFTQEEVAMALTRGFQTVSLGATRLRTETAALVACHAVNFINE